MADPLLLTEENVAAFVQEGLAYMRAKPRHVICAPQTVLLSAAMFNALSATVEMQSRKVEDAITLETHILGTLQFEKQRGIEFTKIPYVDVLPDNMPYNKPKKPNTGLRLGSYKFKGK